MAETGDRETPNGPPHDGVDGPDLDAAVGFASPQALVGRPRAPAVEAPPELPPEPEPVAVAPEPEPEAERAPVVAAPVEPSTPEPPPAEPPPASPRRADTGAAMGRAGAESIPSAPTSAGFGGRRAQSVAEAPMGLYAIYALILFAVPTLGASAVIGLASVVFRDPPTQEPWASHHVFQLRTLWTAAVVALLGVILIVVNLGVFVLFTLVIWLVIRGAWGVWLLTGGRAVPRPRSWLV